jgi:hypothetical protein
MSLPKIVSPKFPITIPSTKQNTFFRPFIMREQKILMMAMDGGDPRHMTKAIAQIVEQCIDGIDDAQKMPMFDLEYLFLKIRSKSVGEMVSLTVKCPKCEKVQPTEVNLEEVEVDRKKDVSSKIMLTDKLGVVMRYPCLGDAIVGMEGLDASGVLKFVSDSIEIVFDEDMTYTRKDFSEKEILNFVESMTTAQFEKINEFYNNIPQLRKEVEQNCIGCGSQFKIDFRGIQDFFT